MVEVSDLYFLQCFDTISWVTGKVSGTLKNWATYSQKFFSRTGGGQKRRRNHLTQVLLEADVETGMGACITGYMLGVIEFYCLISDFYMHSVF